MTNTSGNLNSIGLVLYALIATVFCTKDGLALIVFFHEGITDNELFPLLGKKAIPMKGHFIWSYSSFEGKAKNIQANIKQTNKKILSSKPTMLGQAVAAEPMHHCLEFRCCLSELAGPW